MVKQVKKVVSVLSKETQEPAIRLVQQVEQMLPLVERVIAQTRKRVLENKKVPSNEKVLSLFEPHTRAIPRRHPVARWSSLGDWSR
jgi:transposase, IS5 family